MTIFWPFNDYENIGFTTKQRLQTNTQSTPDEFARVKIHVTMLTMYRIMVEDPRQKDRSTNGTQLCIL